MICLHGGFPLYQSPIRHVRGGADEYLELLTSAIMPEVQNSLGIVPEYSAIAGYSLAGLFAVYSIYRTDVFTRVASASGSFWFPSFDSFVKEHKPVRKPEKIYFSLGDRESYTKKEILNSVEARTKWLADWYQDGGTKTTFVLNPGDHFKNPVNRMADGIRWILED